MIDAVDATATTPGRGRAMERVRRWTGRSMASPLELTVVDGEDAPEPHADRAWGLVIDEFAGADLALSRFRADSEITDANEASLRGEPTAVGRRLAIALHASDQAHRLTGGRFDPRVLAQLEAWGYPGAPLGQPLPTVEPGTPGPIVERLDRDRVRLPHPVDLGGIGKGLAVRWAAAGLRRAGFDRFLLDAGGDIATAGAGPDGGPWRIGIEDPVGDATPLAVVAIDDGAAIATSSIKRLHWTMGGDTRHHLVDPATGAPADGDLLAVTVVTADTAWAEVWAKALFIAGRRRIGEEARSRDLAAWWIASDGSLSMTPAARQRTMWVAAED